MAELKSFWQKINNDWIFGLTGSLAYSLISSLIPVILLIIGFAGILIGKTHPLQMRVLIEALVSSFPKQLSRQIVLSIFTDIHQNANIFTFIGLLFSLWFGSRLFVSLEHCFGIIFHFHPRKRLEQNIIAFQMTILFVILAPFAIFFTSLSSLARHSGFVNLYQLLGHSYLASQTFGYVSGTLVAFVLFLCVYGFVPNRSFTWKETWPGAALAAVLLEIYDGLFPVYASDILHPFSSYGLYIGLFTFLIVFFYYFAFILLLGSEVNAWIAGCHGSGEDLFTILLERHESYQKKLPLDIKTSQAGNDAYLS